MLGCEEGEMRYGYHLGEGQVCGAFGKQFPAGVFGPTRLSVVLWKDVH